MRRAGGAGCRRMKSLLLDEAEVVTQTPSWRRARSPKCIGSQNELKKGLTSDWSRKNGQKPVKPWRAGQL